MSGLLLTNQYQSIQRHFEFLFEEGFEFQDPVSYEKNLGSWNIYLISENLRVAITQDRGDIFFSLAPKPAVLSRTTGNEFIGLEIVLVYLTGEKKYYPYLLENEHDLESKLAKLAELAKANWPSILKLFTEDYSPSKKSELTLLADKLFQEKFGANR